MAARCFTRVVSRVFPSKLIKRIQWIQEQINPSSQTKVIHQTNRISRIKAHLLIAIGGVAVVADVAVVVSPATSRTRGRRILAKVSSNTASAARDSSAAAETISRTVAGRVGRAVVVADAEALPSWVRWTTAIATPTVAGTSMA